MVVTIKWVNLNQSGDPDARGYWLSSEGRYYISPNFWGRTTPQDYSLQDKLNGGKLTFDTVKECKAAAVARSSKEMSKEVV